MLPALLHCLPPTPPALASQEALGGIRLPGGRRMPESWQDDMELAVTMRASSFARRRQNFPESRGEEVPLVSRGESDPLTYKNALDFRAREHQVALEDFKILREQLSNCYAREGVNHAQKCRDLRVEYKARLHQPHWKLPAAPADEE